MKFYELPPEKRRALLASQGLELADLDSATLAKMDQLSENVVGRLSLPVGLVTNLVVNGQSYLVPMATEEPSVVAAANHGASIFTQNGGTKVTSERQGIYGQIVLQAADDFELADFEQSFPKLIEITNREFSSLVHHGGGVRQITARCEHELVYLQVLVDPAQAMGANKVNSILEFMAEKLAIFPEIKAKLFAILSNYPSQISRVKVQLSVQSVGGKAVAQQIALLSQIGETDPMRGVTNNKGIMNGVDAVLQATGNDTRSVEAACGLWASRHGQYRSLSSWRLEDDMLHGELSLPLALGTVGGSIYARLDVQENYRMLGSSITSQQLAEVVVSIGLANNLAALLAIATTGIQAGHMKLQARNIVATLSANDTEKQQVLSLMKQDQNYTQAAAQKYLIEIRKAK
ncbi:hydroxymethylglutaryl-CoA reductase [Lactobacillus sp. ESL0681]|uniref:hydroxymethylglutaryl-CoA reductase n=1 Tax=Lactobacillus sp. ESL0681 TaxID=2983211 RepID=UPI0023F8479B|nr:hydroxymethylglutaryl-CoA reductase [Lactobacillus sp. ESL0681]WEV40392.1 hydroxymethylglutaryl-CoA reductase [Lactobacillus sp. ESL0681]